MHVYWFYLDIYLAVKEFFMIVIRSLGSLANSCYEGR